ncbi:glycine-rich domain-containing protein [Rhodopila globiformis]|uniref:Glycine-rich domain-containing protein n=1 Tax=Rhodopila globiformis TaxID=1071 RepID=A0A2S6NIF5_RHOGL|nr:hypothetical protein [Rhodopila globiformis]PPQ34334.1 hypothetical protein CCS01_11220 [Rhodopila globiformis]
MDRTIVYPGAIPLDTDLLSINKNTMIGLGFLAQAVLGTNTVVDGLACQPTTPASMSVTIGGGSITQLAFIDSQAYGSIPADTSAAIIKMGINPWPTTLTLTAPSSVGQSIAYLVQAAFQEQDDNPVVLPYYNASNPAQSFSGPSNSGAAQNTLRAQTLVVQLKAGIPANSGSQITPTADAGWIGLYQIVVAYGQTEIDGGNGQISVVPTAPFLTWKLPALRPGFGSGVQSFTSSGNFTVPPGVTQVEVEVWGGGSGSYASAPGQASGGGAGGGYAKKLVTGLTPGQIVPVTVGAGGSGGTTGGTAPTAGGTSSFGPFVSAKGGSLNSQATVSAPQNGATPPGYGVGGDVNLTGSAGQAGLLNQGGMGGGAPMGGSQNSGTIGNPGTFPGGGAAGAGTGANSNTAYPGASGGGGLVVVRY